MSEWLSWTEELFTDLLLNKVQSVLSDTTAVNTGSKKGINTRLREFFKNKMGRDIHPFECLFHVLELNLKLVCYTNLLSP